MIFLPYINVYQRAKQWMRCSIFRWTNDRCGLLKVSMYKEDMVAEQKYESLKNMFFFFLPKADLASTSVAEYSACQDQAATFNFWYDIILMGPSSYPLVCGWGKQYFVLIKTDAKFKYWFAFSSYRASAIFRLLKCFIHLHGIPRTSPPINRPYGISGLKPAELASLTMCISIRSRWLFRMVAWSAKGSAIRRQYCVMLYYSVVYALNKHSIIF